jgi:hypothetical protein
VGNVDGVFVNNWIEGVGHVGGTIPTDQLWPSDNGFFFEISKGAVCAGNVFVDCDHGLMVLNSSHVRIYQNTFVNSVACVGRNARTAAGDRFGWHASTGPDMDKREGHVFVNNLLVGEKNFTRPLLFVWQPASLCQQLPKPQLNELDHNVYVRCIEKTPYPLILWSPAPGDRCQAGFASPEELRKQLPEFSAHSRSYVQYDGPLFQSMELRNYRLLREFAGANSGGDIPGEIRTLIGSAVREGGYVGAYSPLK